MKDLSTKYIVDTTDGLIVKGSIQSTGRYKTLHYMPADDSVFTKKDLEYILWLLDHD